MQGARVRFERIVIENFKNVEHGELSFHNSRRPNGPSILGLYGQNGSGKSTLVDVLEVVKHCLSGTRIAPGFAQYLTKETDRGFVECEFSIKDGEGAEKRVIYSFNACVIEHNPDEETGRENSANDESKSSLSVFNERLSMPLETSSGKSRMEVVIDTSGNAVFTPTTRYEQIIGTETGDEIDLVVEKRLAYRESRSFVFSREFQHAVQNTVEHSEGDEPSLAKAILKLLKTLSLFSHFEFFVLNAQDTGMLALDGLPFPFRIKEGDKIIGGEFLLPMDGTRTIPVEYSEATSAVIENTNIVLREIIPGLQIRMRVLGEELMNDGHEGKRVQLVSQRGDRVIPLSCESEGIKRIVSFLHLLILVHNDPSVTVVIDELDSGVFEYLLGELVGIVSENGKGQLIFTSHNLRPLETIDKGFVAFTTVNPKNRYTRMNYVKTNHNLRDFYYRDILLGGQKELLYDMTNNGDIEFAFREAGFTND